MDEERREATDGAPPPEAQGEAGWHPDSAGAAAALLGRLGIPPEAPQVGALLEVALWRKSCHALVATLDRPPAVAPADASAPSLAEQASLLLAQVPEAVFLAILAQNLDPGPGVDAATVMLGRACLVDAEEQRLIRLAAAIRRHELPLDADRLNASLADLHAALSPADVGDAGADPLFVLQLVLMLGGDGKEVALPQDPAALLRVTRQSINAARLAAAAALLGAQGHTQGAETFRMLQTLAEAVRAGLAGKPVQWDLPAVDATLRGVAAAEAGLLAAPSRLSHMVASQKSALLGLLAVDPAIPLEKRRDYCAMARHSLEQLHARLKSTGQPLSSALIQESRLVWQAAEQETGERRAAGRAEAITRMHELLAIAAEDTDTMARLNGIAAVSIALATAHYETGAFRAATDQAIIARRVARAADQLLADAVGEESRPADEMLRVARASLAGLVAQADRTDLIARARLAEGRGDFEEASTIYTSAIALEGDLKQRMREILAALFGTAGQASALAGQGFEAEARAAHFAGLAAINRADAALMAGEHQAARTGYEQARASLGRAAELWTEARATLPPGQQANDAARQAQVSALRARYCDCKLELAQAERLIALRDHLGAAGKFIAARTVLQELVERSLDVDEHRNQQILLGSKFYADARSLFEIDLESGADDNLRAARKRMTEAAGIFESVGEARWAAFIRAQAAACEAQVLQAKAEASPTDPTRAVLVARADDRRQDAADLLAQAGGPAAGAARGGGGHQAWPGIVVLPKPQAPIAGAGDGPGMPAPTRPEDDARAALLASKRALEETIRQLRDLQERGAIDPGRWASLNLEYQQKFFSVTQQLDEAAP